MIGGRSCALISGAISKLRAKNRFWDYYWTTDDGKTVVWTLGRKFKVMLIARRKAQEELRKTSLEWTESAWRAADGYASNMEHVV